MVYEPGSLQAWQRRQAARQGTAPLGILLSFLLVLKTRLGSQPRQLFVVSMAKLGVRSNSLFLSIALSLSFRYQSYQYDSYCSSVYCWCISVLVLLLSFNMILWKLSWECHVDNESEGGSRKNSREDEESPTRLS